MYRDMRIGIDISQIVHEGTGVSRYVLRIVTALVRKDTKNEYILFGASLRKRSVFRSFAASLGVDSKRVRLVIVPIPPTLLDIIWNRWHIIPIEWLIGRVDVFWSSDWTQPPLAYAKGVTTIHDLSVVKFPEESHNTTDIDVMKGKISANIVSTQKSRLKKAASTCRYFFCDSETTRQDAHALLGIDQARLRVVYPGYI